MDISAANATTSSHFKMDASVHFEAVFSKFTASGKFKYIKINQLLGFTSKSDAGVAFESFPPAGKIGLKDGILNM
ncbi:TPA: hypothetical protein ACFP41_000956 [Neisseria weaveri]